MAFNNQCDWADYKMKVNTTAKKVKFIMKKPTAKKVKPTAKKVKFIIKNPKRKEMMEDFENFIGAYNIIYSATEWAEYDWDKMYIQKDEGWYCDKTYKKMTKRQQKYAQNYNTKLANEIGEYYSMIMDKCTLSEKDIGEIHENAEDYQDYYNRLNMYMDDDSDWYNKQWLIQIFNNCVNIGKDIMKKY